MSLTTASIAKLTEPKLYLDGRKLYLKVTKQGTKQWVFVFRWKGKRDEMGLGGYPATSIPTARKLADQARVDLALGVNPKVARRKARQSVPTFGEFADNWIDTHESEWKSEKHRAQWRYTVEVDAKRLRHLRLDEIEVEDVLRILKPIWLVKPETARRCRGRIERILSAAKARKFRTGENPAAWSGNLEDLLPKQSRRVVHHPAMPHAALAPFLNRIRCLPGTAAKALEFTVLTAARTSETLGAKWSEIDSSNRIWTVPAERMKMKAVHRVPLNSQAVDLLERVRAEVCLVTGFEPRPEDLIFSRRPGMPMSNMAMTMLLRRLKVTEASVHGFRSTFRDWVGETTDYPRELAELSLAHLVGTEVERAYSRGDLLERRRPLMKDWGDFCAGIEVAVIAAEAA